MQDDLWVIVDTETDGLSEPIHVVEIGAQLMKGREAYGEPFRVFLNHGVPIPAAAVAIHGYTEEFLDRNGIPPAKAHEQFRNYACNLPLVSHNLAYDWNAALYPEWLRLGIEPIGRRGFCAMMLARRVVNETKTYRLEALKDCFGIKSGRSHHAVDDAVTVTQLFEKVYYAWGRATTRRGNEVRLVIVLGVKPVDSPFKAVQVSILADVKAKQP